MKQKIYDASEQLTESLNTTRADLEGGISSAKAEAAASVEQLEATLTQLIADTDERGQDGLKAVNDRVSSVEEVFTAELTRKFATACLFLHKGQDLKCESCGGCQRAACWVVLAMWWLLCSLWR